MRETKGLEKKRQRVTKSERECEKEGEPGKSSWRGEVNAAHTGCKRANQQGPEREKSGMRQRGRHGQKETVDLKDWELKAWARWQRQPPELRVKLRAVPSSCPPAPRLRNPCQHTQTGCIPDPGV